MPKGLTVHHLKTGDPDSPCFRVLYGQDTVQVRVWQLRPGAWELPLGPGEYFVLQGSLQFADGTRPKNHGMGQRFSLENTGQQTVRVEQGPLELLEIGWPTGSPAVWENVPLAEVTEVRPWGSFTVLADEPDYKLKQLWVNPDNRLSLQRHQKREEHWFVIQGQPQITLNESIERYQPQDYIHIPLHAWHRIANPGPEGVEIIELQLGSYFGEDDIERREDDYGRR